MNSSSLANHSSPSHLSPNRVPYSIASPAGCSTSDSCRIYDSSAILDFVSNTPHLLHLQPQSPAEHDATSYFLHFADNILTPHITTWLYATIGLIPFVHLEIEAAQHALVQAMTSLDAILVNAPFLIHSRLTVADVAVVISLFPAYKNLFDHETTQRFPAVTRWFLSSIHNAFVQHLYALLQQGQITCEPKLEALKKKVTVSDFHIIQVLGKGCMGKVLLVRHKRSSNLYALKSISKSSVIMNKELIHTLAERNILSTIAQIKHPFLIQCHNAFTSENELFLVLDFIAGGDVATQLAKYGRFSQTRTQFYAAEIVLGLLELHRLGVVYRDLKPENILVQLDGHIILTDFGLSKMFRASSSDKSEARTNTFAGTAEYLAPEILRNDEYGFEVDWWSFGTLVYEMLVGRTPFWADNHSIMYQRVLDDPLTFPADIQADAKSFLVGLLDRDPQRRLGSGPNEARDIQSHCFFRAVCWEDFYYKRVCAPYLPKVRNPLDLSNFEDCFTSMSPKLSPPSHDLSASLQDYFLGYSWAPGAPITPVSHSSTPLASTIYGSSMMSLASSLGAPSRMDYPPYVHPAQSAKSAVDSPLQHSPSNQFLLGGADADFAMDFDDQHRPQDDLGDLSPQNTSAAVAITQLTFNPRIKKPPVTPAASPLLPGQPKPFPVSTPAGQCSFQPSPWTTAVSLSSPILSRPATPTATPLVMPGDVGADSETASCPSLSRRQSLVSASSALLKRSNSSASTYWQLFTSSRS